MSRGCTRGCSRWDWGLGLGAWIRGPWDWYLNLRAPLPGRRKKLRFHPRQLYLSVKQGDQSILKEISPGCVRTKLKPGQALRGRLGLRFSL